LVWLSIFWVVGAGRASCLALVACLVAAVGLARLVVAVGVVCLVRGLCSAVAIGVAGCLPVAGCSAKVQRRPKPK
jgi:hypothetical protein